MFLSSRSMPAKISLLIFCVALLLAMSNAGSASAQSNIFSDLFSYPVGNSAYSVESGDLNNDGKPDLVTVTSNDNISVLLGNGDGTFQAAVNYAAGGRVPLSIEIVDTNGDHKSDLVTANRDSANVSVLLGNGNGTFQNARNSPAGEGPSYLTVSDFNRDGRPDLAIVNQGIVNSTRYGLDVLFGKGDGTFQPPVTYRIGELQRAVAAGDFNNDDKPDLLITNSTGNLSVMLGNGDGTFQSAQNINPASSYFGSITLGDFNRDGRIDFVTKPSDTNNMIAVFLGNGDGTFQDPQSYFAGVYPGTIVVGDFNRDGYPDLAAPKNFMSNTCILAGNCDIGVSLLFGNGDGTFQTLYKYAELGGPYSLAVGDFNRDGKPDLAEAYNYAVGVRLNLVISQSTAPTLLTVENSGRAIALDSVTFVRDPFPVITTLNFSPDQRTRITLFALDLNLLPGDNPSLVAVEAEDSQQGIHPLITEYVGRIPFQARLIQIIAKLPDDLQGAGNVRLSLKVRGLSSNKAFVTIK